MGASCSNRQKVVRNNQQKDPLNENNCKQSISQQYGCSIWDSHKLRWVKKTYQIISTKDNVIKYLCDGQLFKMEQGKKHCVSPDILTNLEQIKYLQWTGKYGQIDLKVGKWIATWKGETLKDVGGQYLNNGQKHGQWTDIIKNYWTNAQIYEVGEYMNEKKQGKWKYLYQDKEIGGGFYEGGGDNMKIGKWIEISDRYQQFSQVSYNGEYKNGKKVGLWNIFYNGGDYKQIGGGSYDERGNGIKVGRWIELSDDFYEYSQVTYIGEYQNGKKIGRWCILWWDYYTNNNEQIGGGSYDQGGDGIKIGKWIELSDGFWRDSQVTYNGMYKNGKKVGDWGTWYSERERNKKRNELIGGGSYDEEGQEIKIGKWTEKSDGYLDRSQVTYNGEYKNDKKEGRWDIMFKNRITNNHELIGGGLYDYRGGGIKIGQWIELSDDFHECSQVTYIGKYKNGKKDGRWDIWYKNRDIKINELIGGGSYDEVADGLKIGKWIELNDWFSDSSQVTNEGEYKNGQKTGKWNIWYQNKDTKINQLIGGGYYNEQCDEIKDGIWIELNDGFWDYSQVIYNGKYISGKKVGRWDIKYEGSLIGGGSYNEEGNGIKVGMWIELKNGFQMFSQVAYKGEYKNGKKVGTWMEIMRKWNEKEFIQIGEVKYNN